MKLINEIIEALRNRYYVKLAYNIGKRHKILFSTKLDKTDADVFLDIFLKRIYAPGFPFYQDCTVIDIGAHKGFFTLFANKYSGEKTKIFSIEPEPNNYQELITNIKFNKCQNITPVECAISGATSKMKLYISESVNHSLIPLSNTHPYIHQNNFIEIQSFSLADFVSKNHISYIDYLKIDCEGGEYEILFNTSNELFEKIHTIALEFHDISKPDANIYTLLKFLHSKNFKIINLNFQMTPLPLNLGILIMSRV